MARAWIEYMPSGAMYEVKGGGECCCPDGCCCDVD